MMKIKLWVKTLEKDLLLLPINLNRKVKLFTSNLVLILMMSITTLYVDNANAQTPFSCDSIYLSEISLLRTLNPDSSNFTEDGINQTSALWNAGFNVKDSLIYAIPRSTNQLLSLGADGISNTVLLDQSFTLFNADLDTSNNLYFIPNTGDSLYNVNVTTLEISAVILNREPTDVADIGFLGDISYFPQDQNFYGFLNNVLYRIETNGTVTIVETVSEMPNVVVGASWVDNQGGMYVLLVNGEIHKYDLVSEEYIGFIRTPEVNGSTFRGSDGVGCPFIDPINFPPLAIDDFEELQQATPTIINVLANDQNLDITGDLQINIISQPVGGTAIKIGESIEYTAPLDFLGADTVIIEVCDMTGQCDTSLLILEVEEKIFFEPVDCNTFYRYSTSTPLVFDINRFNIETGQFDTTGVSIDGILRSSGFNVKDSLFYVYNLTTTEVVKYDLSGNMDQLELTRQNFNLSAGDVDTSNQLVAYDRGIGTNRVDSISTINLTTGVVTSVVSSLPGIFFGSLSYNPSDDRFYGIAIDDTLNNILYSVDRSGSVEPYDTIEEIAFDEGLNGITASWFDLERNLYLLSTSPRGIFIYDWSTMEYNTFYPIPNSFSTEDGQGCPDLPTPNFAPAAVNDIVTTVEDSSIVVNVLANDVDVEREGLDFVEIIINPNNGSVSRLADSSISYIPELDFGGIDTIGVVVCDQSNLCDTSFVIITVIPDTVIANDDIRVLDRGGFDDFPPTLNDTLTSEDIEVTLADVTGMTTEGGTISVDENNQITYTPDPNFEGRDTVIYILCDNAKVPPVCDSANVIYEVGKVTMFPIAVTVDTIVAEDSTLFIAPEFNDTLFSDPEFIVVDTIPGGAPLNGTLVITSDSIFEYTPNPDFVGFDTITYVICDTFEFQQPIPETLCDTAQIIIQVNQVHTNTNYFDTTTQFVTDFKTVNIFEDLEDLEDDILFISLGPGSGTLSIEENLPEDSTLTYTPNPGFVGTDTILFSLRDNLDRIVRDTLFIVVEEFIDSIPRFTTPLEDTLEIEIDAGDTAQFTLKFFDFENDEVNISIIETSSETIERRILGEFVPFETIEEDTLEFLVTYDGISLVDSFQIQVCQNESPLFSFLNISGCDTITVFITVADSIKVPPVAVDDTIREIESGGTVTVDVVENDTLNGGVLSVFQLPSNGTIIQEESIFTYTANEGFEGIDTLIYVLSRNGSDTAIVTFEVLPDDPEFNPIIIEGVSADGDGINDVLTIRNINRGVEEPYNYDHQVSVKIYNRLGRRVYSEDDYNENDPERSWSGQNENGNELPEGTYFYRIIIEELDFDENGYLVFINRN